MTFGPSRQLFANRTLNLRSVRTIGYDMDYTLIHYNVFEWEGSAFAHAKVELAGLGWPVDDLAFDRSQFSLGLVFDLELGNLVKATRFGYVVRAQHGNDMMAFEDHRGIYRDSVISLSSERYEFMNTLFEMSRASLWCQCVALHDENPLPGVRSYGDLYRAVDLALNHTHRVGTLKSEILADPERFVDHDPDIVQTLKDQRLAGKSLVLITNSEWSYTRQMMEYAVDPFCGPGESWRDLFDVIVVSANKPRFFTELDPIFAVVDEEKSLLLPHTGPLERGTIYFGGNATLVEDAVNSGLGQTLYVGDHLFGDVHVSKDFLQWRTALITRGMENEVEQAAKHSDQMSELGRLMTEKIALEARVATLRMERTRALESRGKSKAKNSKEIEQLNRSIAEVDARIAPLARLSSSIGHPNWGLLMRAGNDKSLYARQVERYADVYTSRVSNFMEVTPYAYLRAARGSLPHDGIEVPALPE